MQNAPQVPAVITIYDMLCSWCTSLQLPRRALYNCQVYSGYLTTRSDKPSIMWALFHDAQTTLQIGRWDAVFLILQETITSMTRPFLQIQTNANFMKRMTDDEINTQMAVLLLMILWHFFFILDKFPRWSFTRQRITENTTTIKLRDLKLCKGHNPVHSNVLKSLNPIYCHVPPLRLLSSVAFS